MYVYCRTDEEEESVNGAAVRRVEVEWLHDERQGQDDVVWSEDDRRSDMRDSDAVTDRRDPQPVARQQDLQEHVAVGLVSEGHEADDLVQDRFEIRSADVIVDASRPERICERGHAAFAAEYARLDADVVLGGPLEEVGPVDAVLAADLLRGQVGVFDPVVHARFRGAKECRRFTDGELHVASKCRLVARSVSAAATKPIASSAVCAARSRSMRGWPAKSLMARENARSWPCTERARIIATTRGWCP